MKFLKYILLSIFLVIGLFSSTLKANVIEKSTSNIFTSKQFLENVKRIDLDADGLKVLNKDLANKEFAEAIIRNPDLVDAWKILDDLGEAKFRADINWLKRVNGRDGAGVQLSKNGDNIKLSDASGNALGEFKNGNLLPDKYDFPVNANARPVGDINNGYQVFKNGNNLSVRRVPDKSAYNSSELTELTQHPRAHVLERHGHDVTDDALLKRANRGIAPDGSKIGNPNNPVKPPYSSKFESPAKLKLALNNTKPGSTAFANKVSNQHPNGYNVTFELTDGAFFGKGVPRNENSFENMTKVIASYEETSPGIFQLVTMYPTK